ncbi:MAG: hypothetical protein AAF393_05410 [Pseudomonadota bacterium]
MDRLAEFQARGWVKFPQDVQVARWAEAALAPALQVARDPGAQADWLRCDGTWFVGVHSLPNGADGSVGGAPLAGEAVDFAKTLVPEPFTWDKAQVSICYRGYPKPWDGETEAAARYRRNRDAAHIDGLHRTPPDNRRTLGEYHQFLLGVPLNDPPAEAAPFVVWEGSHHLIRQAFETAFDGVAPEDWHNVNATDIYQATRRRIFDECPRIEVPVRLGEATIVHRHALHGMAPWADELEGPAEGRIIAYFRPEAEMPRRHWLEA